MDASSAESAIEIRDLVKRHPKFTTNAVDGISFSVRRGEIFGLLALRTFRRRMVR